MADVTRLTANNSVTTPKGEDPKIIRVAKLALMVSSKDLTADDKLCCIQAGIRAGIITKEEAAQFRLYMSELENFLDGEDE